MGLPSKKAQDFFSTVMENMAIPTIFVSVRYFDSEVQNKDFLRGTKDVDSYYSFRLVPAYMIPRTETGSPFLSKVLNQFNWGYSIYLKDTVSIDDYLQKQFKSKYRSIIRRYVNRLEHCFPVQYKLFYGDIDEETYCFVMNSLRKMIIARFGQRKETHKEFHRWETLVKETRAKILNKQASLFVIYDAEHPIQISLNYHFGKILFSAISSYDIDYAKFGLGHVEIYKQLQWCIKNGYYVYEMGVGGMDYKRRWSNNIYQYQHYIIYPKSKPLTKLFAKIEIMRVIVKEYLKSKNVNELVYKLKDRIVKKRTDWDNTSLNVEITDTGTSVSLDGYHVLELSKSSPHFLKKYLYDFLYAKVENINDVLVLQSKEIPGNYLFRGNLAAQQLKIRNEKGA